MQFPTVTSRRSGKTFEQYLLLISSIKSGKKTVGYGDGYVVISRKCFDELAGTVNKELAQQHLTQAKASAEEPPSPQGEICANCKDWIYEDGSPKYKSWKYCPNCGRKLPLA